MKKFLIWLLVAALSFPVSTLALAEKKPIVVYVEDSKAAHHHFVVKVDVHGNIQLVPITQVFTVGEGVDPPTKPGPVDPTPTPHELSKKVAKWTKDVNDPRSAQGLSIVYSLTLSRLEKDKVKPSEVLTEVKAGTDSLLSKLGVASKWDGWRGALAAELKALAEDGKLANKADYVKLLQDVLAGLNDGALGDDRAAALNWGNILQLIIAVIQDKEELDWGTVISLILQLLN